MKILILNYVSRDVCLCVDTRVHMGQGAPRGQKMALIPPRMELQAVISQTFLVQCKYWDPNSGPREQS